MKRKSDFVLVLVYQVAVLRFYDGQVASNWHQNLCSYDDQDIVKMNVVIYFNLLWLIRTEEILFHKYTVFPEYIKSELKSCSLVGGYQT